MTDESHAFYMHVGDTRPYVREALLDENDAPINLTGAGVVFSLEGANVISGTAAAIIDAVDGLVEYRWTVGDIDSAGLSYRRWYVTLSDATVFHVPNFGRGYPVIAVN